MAHYVDIETTAEALEEEKELTEAVEALVGQAASSVRDEIVLEIVETVQGARTWLETTFPLLILYQTRHDLMLEHMKDLCILLLLAMMAFVSLAPWQRRRRKAVVSRNHLLQRANSFGWTSSRGATVSLGRSQSQNVFRSSMNSRVMRQSLFSKPGMHERHPKGLMMGEAPASPESTSFDGANIEPETDEEIFEQNYPTMVEDEKYSRLLLPPTCRRIVQSSVSSLPKLSSSSKQSPPDATREKSPRTKRQKVPDSHPTKEISSVSPEPRDDPALRLQAYFQYFVNLALYLVSLLYAQFGLALVLWILGIWQQRQSSNKANADTGEGNPSQHHEPKMGSASTNETVHQEVNSETASTRMTTEANQRTTRDDETDATSGVDNATDEDGLSASRCASPSPLLRVNQDPLAGQPIEDDCFLTPSPKGLNVATDAETCGPEIPLEKDSSKAEMSGTRELHPSQSPFRSFRNFFDSAPNQATLDKLSADSPVPDRNGYILGDEFLPSTQQTPLLVFVNSRSGPQQGQLLISQLRRLLNPIQVWDLADGEPGPVLESFCVLTKLRILVCGGDGSVSWIISALEKLNLQRKWPPIGILPLGTGNDLARIMGWGGGYTNESLLGILQQISDAYTSLLDRWEMFIDGKHHKDFFNYFGVGADAEAALQVHYLRESRPEWFFSRLVNKAWYGVFGAEDILKNTVTTLHKDMVLYADGVEVPLPADSQGIIVLNIDSYMGGIPIWSHGWRNPQHSDRRPAQLSQTHRRSTSAQQLHGSDFPLRRSTSMDGRSDSSEYLLGLLTEEERYERVTACDLPASCQDGILEVVSIRSLFHLGQIRVGLSNAQRLCQGRHIKIVTRKKAAFQIDGEPWRQEKCVLEIRRKKDPALMLHRSMEDGVEVEMSKLLEWAEERKLIDAAVHRSLMKEFSRRIESKLMRNRRTATGGVLQNLTRRRTSQNTGRGGISGLPLASSQPDLSAGSSFLLAPRRPADEGNQSMLWPNGISF